MLTEFQKIVNRRHVFSGFVSRDLHLMIPNRRGKIPLRFIVVDPYIYHTLYHTARPFSA